jgi:thiamine-monophosphate kinase
VDQVIEGVHVRVDARPGAVGRKAADRALSDLAACGARPRALLAAVRAPRDRSEAWLRALLAAIDARGQGFGAALRGGDLAQGRGPASVSVTAVGILERGLRAPRRDRVRPGQVLLLTGPVGGSALGRHLKIEPRLAQGRWLLRQGAAAMIDVSDGLARDLQRLARAGGVRVELDEVPVHRDARRAARLDGRSARWHALHDGEDHELIVALPPGAAGRVLAAASRHAPGLVRIGRVVSGRGVCLQGVEWDGRGGWLHGSG